MPKRKMQRSVAAHGNAGDGPIGTAWRSTIAAFDVREKFLHQKIFVALFSVSCVDIKGGPGIRRCNQKLLQLTGLAHVFHYIPGAGMDEKLFVVPQAMEEIQNRE